MYFETPGCSPDNEPVPSVPAVGCATCWAAKYCAVFSLAAPQPPPECPLLPAPARRRRPSPLRQVAHFSY